MNNNNNKTMYIANPMLVGAMELVKKNKSPENLKVLMDELAHSRLLSPVVITPQPTVDETGKVKMAEDSKFSVPMLAGPDGRKFFVAYTDMNEIKKIKSEKPINVFPFAFTEYAAMVAKADAECDGLAINPQSNGPIIAKPMIAAIMNTILKKNAETATEE